MAKFAADDILKFCCLFLKKVPPIVKPYFQEILFLQNLSSAAFVIGYKGITCVFKLNMTKFEF